MNQSTRILIVDDNPAMVRLLSKWLDGERYEVLSASDGRTAREMIETERPNILITDWEMEHLDGRELCRWVRQQNSGHYIYTIFLTVRSSPDDTLDGLEAGADDFLKKPVDRGEFLARIRAGLRVMELERRLSQLASTDAITGLATRRTLFDNWKREWHRSTRHHVPLSCVMIDIDFFKRINDANGHQAGDDVLRQLGQLFSASIRGSDMAGRYGGEEFCVILPETTEQQAQQWAERMRARVAALSVPAGDTTLSVTASFGVAERLADTSSAEQLVDMADQALLAAKRSGRDRVVTYRTLTQTALDSGGSQRATLLQGIPASEVMTPIVAPLNENHSVATATSYFLRLRIPSSPVVDNSGQLVGMVSEKDLMALMLGEQWWTVPIKDVMKRNVVCYEEDAPSLAIFEFLSRVAIRGVVIVNQGRPTGLITRGCLLRFFRNMLAIRRTDGICPEVDAAAAELGERVGSGSTGERMSQTIHSLAAEACDMEWQLANNKADLVPSVVAGASRIQELVIDLLAISRYAHEWNAPQDSMRRTGCRSQVSGAIQFAISRTINQGDCPAGENPPSVAP
jgi:diguanylate cyclase (GGDEF)-like protein